MHVTREMPKYQCHKQVWALKIKELRQAPASSAPVNLGGDWFIVPEDDAYEPIMVGHYKYYDKYRPVPGGYYVLYEDGYQSYSPASAFESGYTLIG